MDSEEDSETCNSTKIYSFQIKINQISDTNNQYDLFENTNRESPWMQSPGQYESTASTPSSCEILLSNDSDSDSGSDVHGPDICQECTKKLALREPQTNTPLRAFGMPSNSAEAYHMLKCYSFIVLSRSSSALKQVEEENMSAQETPTSENEEEQLTDEHEEELPLDLTNYERYTTSSTMTAECETENTEIDFSEIDIDVYKRSVGGFDRDLLGVVSSDILYKTDEEIEAVLHPDWVANLALQVVFKEGEEVNMQQYIIQPDLKGTHIKEDIAKIRINELEPPRNRKRPRWDPKIPAETSTSCDSAETSATQETLESLAPYASSSTSTSTSATSTSLQSFAQNAPPAVWEPFAHYEQMMKLKPLAPHANLTRMTTYYDPLAEHVPVMTLHPLAPHAHITPVTTYNPPAPLASYAPSASTAYYAPLAPTATTAPSAPPSPSAPSAPKAPRVVLRTPKGKGRGKRSSR